MAAKVRSYEDFDYDQLLTYAGIDCLVTSDIARSLFPQISTTPSVRNPTEAGFELSQIPSIMWEMDNFKMPAHEFLIDLELVGFKYDIGKNREFNTRMIEEIRSLEAEIFKHVPSSVNLDSPTELGKYLFGTLKLAPSGFTKSGAPSTDGDSLKTMAKENKLPWLTTLAKRNDICSLHNSFISTYVEDYVKRDGRIHPTYKIIGTSSHRISAENPNLLNLPNPLHGYNIRECYTVDDGMVFLAFDFSSCEVKILGALCKDPILLAAIAAKKDFHIVTACAINGWNYDEVAPVVLGEDESHSMYKVWKSGRKAAKSVTFAILYGSSVAAIADSLGISVEDAERLVALYFETYPKIKEYVDFSHQMAIANGYIWTPFGQRKMEYGAMECFKYTAVHNASLRNAQNVRIQSTASTLGLVAFTKLNEEVKRLGGRAICTVYDSIELEVPLARVAEAIELGFYCMDDWPVEVFDWLDLPIGADVEVGWNWGNVHKFHRGATQGEIEDALKHLDESRYSRALALAA